MSAQTATDPQGRPVMEGQRIGRCSNVLGMSVGNGRIERLYWVPDRDDNDEIVGRHIEARVWWDDTKAWDARRLDDESIVWRV